MIDTHAHLCDSQFDADRDQALERAWSAGVAAFVEIGESEEQWPRARALAEAHPGRVWWAAGCHPYYADQVTPAFLDRLRQALAHPRCVALGEVGLDYCKAEVPPETQKRALAALAALAVEAGKPLVLHCREKDPASTAAQADLINILAPLFPPAAPPKGVAHCFQGVPAYAEQLIERGFFIGVDGPLTYPGAGRLRELIKGVPLDRLVLETDSPYLPPQGWRGKRNEPAYLPAVAAALAGLKDASLQDVVRTTTANAVALYRLPPGFF